jgi:hypothetical protein
MLPQGMCCNRSVQHRSGERVWVAYNGSMRSKIRSTGWSLSMRVGCVRMAPSPLSNTRRTGKFSVSLGDVHVICPSNCALQMPRLRREEPRPDVAQEGVWMAHHHDC